MKLPMPPPLDAVTVAAGSRCIRGDQWIALRSQAAPWGATWEAAWWAEALEKLHEALWVNALAPGPVVARTVRYDEGGRTVTLHAETWGRGVAGEPWGLPVEVRRTLDGLADCPSGGDLLWMPHLP